MESHVHHYFVPASQLVVRREPRPPRPQKGLCSNSNHPSTATFTRIPIRVCWRRATWKTNEHPHYEPIRRTSIDSAITRRGMALPLSKLATRTERYNQLVDDSSSSPICPARTIQPHVPLASKPIQAIGDTHQRTRGPHKITVGEGSRIGRGGRTNGRRGRCSSRDPKRR